MHAFLSSADFFSKSTFLKNSFRNTISVLNSLDQDQAQRFVGPDLSPKCLQGLLAVDIVGKASNGQSLNCLQYLSAVDTLVGKKLTGQNTNYLQDLSAVDTGRRRVNRSESKLFARFISSRHW